MPGPALIFAAPSVGAAAALRKKAENRRKQAASNKWSQKYPLVEDYGTLTSSIQAAKNELNVLNASPATTAGAKRVKKRETEQLAKWISVMLAHSKDLKAGLAPATSSGVPMPMPGYPGNPANETPVLDGGTPTPLGGTPVSLGPSGATEDGQGAGDASAAPGQKKTNWLLIGGVAVGVILLLNFMKKK